MQENFCGEVVESSLEYATIELWDSSTTTPKFGDFFLIQDKNKFFLGLILDIKHGHIGGISREIIALKQTAEQLEQNFPQIKFWAKIFVKIILLQVCENNQELRQTPSFLPTLHSWAKQISIQQATDYLELESIAKAIIEKDITEPQKTSLLKSIFQELKTASIHPQKDQLLKLYDLLSAFCGGDVNKVINLMNNL